MLHKPQERVLFVPAHAKLADVGSLHLAEGQIAIYDLFDTNEDGLTPVKSFEGKSKSDKRYEIRIGRNEQALSRSVFGRDFATRPFAINDVIDIYAAWPKRDKAHKDDVILGYNGVDEATAIVGKKGDRIWVRLKMQGAAFEILGYSEGILMIDDVILLDDCSHLPEDCEACDDCEKPDMLAPVLACIERMKNQPVAGGKRVSDYVDITPVHRCDPEGALVGTEKDMNFYCMEVCDTGDGFALAQVQGQYPGLKVFRTDVKGSISTYKVMKEGAAPANYTQELVSIMKGCKECPQGYTEVEGGFIYSISMEDDGADLSTTIEALPGASTGTAQKMSQNKGTGLYVVALSGKLTKVNIGDFIEANPTAVLTYVAKTSEMCSNPAITSSSWSLCGKCKVSTEKYFITIPDDECGNSSIDDLKMAFPELVIIDYGAGAACQHSFQATVVTNMVCDECDPIFKEYYSSKAPSSYLNREWKILERANKESKNCLCGIRFRGKDILISPSECLIDEMTYLEDSVRIDVSGGMPDEIREGIPFHTDPLHVEFLERYAPRTFVGGNMIDDEKTGYAHFNGRPKHPEFMERTFMNEYSRIDLRAQYVDFQITINPGVYIQGAGQLYREPMTLILRVPYGGHEGVQELVNMIGAAAGLGAQMVTPPVPQNG